MTNSEDRAWAEYSARFRKDVLGKLLNSAMFMSILSGDTDDFPVRFATEVGAALLLNKPVILVIPPGVTIGAGLRRAADYVVEDWDGSPEAEERFAAVLRQFDERDG
jgi:hypothetical protein